MIRRTVIYADISVSYLKLPMRFLCWVLIYLPLNKIRFTFVFPALFWCLVYMLVLILIFCLVELIYDLTNFFCFIGILQYSDESVSWTNINRWKKPETLIRININYIWLNKSWWKLTYWKGDFKANFQFWVITD